MLLVSRVKLAKRDLLERLMDADAELVRRLVRECAALEFGNLSGAARRLGVGYKTLVKYVHELGMEHELDAMRHAAQVRLAVLPQPRQYAVRTMKRGGPRGVR
jgi:hypothetical protein